MEHERREHFQMDWEREEMERLRRQEELRDRGFMERERDRMLMDVRRRGEHLRPEEHFRRGPDLHNGRQVCSRLSFDILSFACLRIQSSPFRQMYLICKWWLLPRCSRVLSSAPATSFWSHGNDRESVSTFCKHCCPDTITILSLSAAYGPRAKGSEARLGTGG